MHSLPLRCPASHLQNSNTYSFSSKHYVCGIDRSRLNVYWLIPCFRNFIISVLNVAAGKAPMQSSVADGGIPQRAVDGSTSTRFDLSTCSLTEVEKSPWWYVNLLEPYMVQLVRIDFGQGCCGELSKSIEMSPFSDWSQSFVSTFSRVE